MWKFYGELQEPKELVVIDAADHLFDGHTSEVGEALEDLLADFTEVGMRVSTEPSHEGRLHRLRGPDAGRQGAERRAARTRGRTRWRRS